MVNTVLCTITADVFKRFADAIEGGKAPKDVAREALNAHWRCIFNGNGYDAAEQAKLTKAGVCRIDSGIEAMKRLSAPENTKLFGDMGVMSKTECEARVEVMFNHYEGIVDMEAKVMIDMINQNVLPSIKASESSPGYDPQWTQQANAAVAAVQAGLKAAMAPRLRSRRRSCPANCVWRPWSITGRRSTPWRGRSRRTSGRCRRTTICCSSTRRRTDITLITITLLVVRAVRLNPPHCPGSSTPHPGSCQERIVPCACAGMAASVI